MILHILGCQTAAPIAEASAAKPGHLARSRFFHRKIRRTEGESWGFALPPPVCCCVARRMARRVIVTFCPSDLPVKSRRDSPRAISITAARGVPCGETEGRHSSFCKEAAPNDSTHLGLPNCSPNRRSFCGEAGPPRAIEIFSQEDQKDRRRELGVRAAAAGLLLRCAPNGAASNCYLLSF